jgi:hypothetical protein
MRNAWDDFPGGEGLRAVLAWPEHGAGKVAILHVFLHVSPLAANPPAQRAPVAFSQCWGSLTIWPGSGD